MNKPQTFSTLEDLRKNFTALIDTLGKEEARRAVMDEFNHLSSSGEQTQEEGNTSPDEFIECHSRNVLSLKPKTLSFPLKRFSNDDASQRKEKKMKETVLGGADNAAQLFMDSLSTNVNAEIQFLNDMLDYYSIENVFPFFSSDSLNDFIMKWIGVNLSTSQLMQGIKNLKEKYETRAAKFGANIDSLDSSGHEALNLGRNIWGSDNETGPKYVVDKLKSQKDLKSGQEQELDNNPHLNKMQEINLFLKQTEQVIEESMAFLDSIKSLSLDK